MNMTPNAIKTTSVLKLLLSMKMGYSHISRNETHIGMQIIAETIHREFYNSYNYDEFIKLFKEDYKNIFDIEELNEL